MISSSHRSRVSRAALFVVPALALLCFQPACNAIFGLDERYPYPPDAGIGGSGGSSACEPGAVESCYAGPADTEGIGVCRAGTKNCNADGLSFGPCQGDVTPQPDNCATPMDEDCDGLAPPCTGAPLWSKRFGGDSDDVTYSVAVNSTGDVLLTGAFSGSIDFGGGPLTSAGLRDLFIVKLEGGTGKHLWSKRYGDAGLQGEIFVTTDNTGNILITGGLYGSLDFGGGVLTGGDGGSLFIVKLNGSGDVLWARSFDNATAGLGPLIWPCSAVAADDTGNIVVSACFRGTVDFGGASLASAGAQDLFAAKFDGDGNHIWAKRFGTSSDPFGVSIAVDAMGNVLLSGSFTGAVDFGSGPVMSPDGYGLYAAKLDPNGDHIWSTRVADATAPQKNITIATDSAGNALLAASFRGTADLGGMLLMSAGGLDLLAAKLNAAERHVFSRRFGDASDQLGLAVAADEVGNAVLTGAFDGTLDFGGGPLASAGAQDILLVKLDANGSHLWSKRFGDSAIQTGVSVVADKANNPVVAGQFYGTVDFGNGTLVSAGSSDIFVAKFSP